MAHYFVFRFSLSVTKLWVPRPCVFCKGGYDAVDTMGFAVFVGLHHYLRDCSFPR